MSYNPQIVDLSFPVIDLSKVFVSGVSAGTLTSIKLFSISGDQIFPSNADQVNIAITTTPQSLASLLGASFTNTIVGITCIPTVELNVYYNFVTGVSPVKVIPFGTPYNEGRVPAFVNLPNIAVGDLNAIAAMPISQTFQMGSSGAQVSGIALTVGAASVIFNPGGSNPINQAYIDMQGWAGGTLYCSAFQAGVTGLVIKGSNDGVNWSPNLICGLSSASGSTNSYSSSLVSGSPYILPSGWRFLQITTNAAATSGTTTIAVHLTAAPPALFTSTLSGSANTIGGLSATTSGGSLLYRNESVGVAGVLVKTGVANLYSIIVSNDTGTKCYLKFYDKATAPVVGTDATLMTFPIPANSTVIIPINAIPLKFSLGIGIGASGLIADSDTTATSANQCMVKLQYQ
jgi:hypothetical protein